MPVYERTLLNGKIDRIETDDNQPIDPDIRDIMAEDEQDAAQIVERNKKLFPEEAATVPYIRIKEDQK